MEVEHHHLNNAVIFTKTLSQEFSVVSAVSVFRLRTKKRETNHTSSFILHFGTAVTIAEAEATAISPRVSGSNRTQSRTLGKGAQRGPHRPPGVLMNTKAVPALARADSPGALSRWLRRETCSTTDRPRDVD